jgi:hypothetical protein
MVWRGLSGVALAALAGCAQVAGFGDVSYDPPAPKVVADAGVDALRAREGGVDAGSEVEAAVEAAVEAKAPPPPATGPTTPPNAGTVDPSVPCNEQQNYVFCEDFDTESAPSADWDYQSLTGTGSLGLSTTAYTSPTKSLHVTVPPGDASSDQASLGKSFGQFAGSVRLAFDFWVNAGSYEGMPVLGVAQVSGTSMAGGTPVSVNVEYAPAAGWQVEAYLSGTSSPPTAIPFPPPALGSWTRLVVSYSATGVVVYENGSQVASDPTATVGGLSGVSIQIGAAYVIPPGTRGVDIQIDNVVLSGG